MDFVEFNNYSYKKGMFNRLTGGVMNLYDFGHSPFNPVGIFDPVCHSLGCDWKSQWVHDRQFRICKRCYRHERKLDSGSMSCPAGKTSYTCMQVAVALGVYCASKNKGDFADLFLTFSSSPQMLKLPMGDIATKIQSVRTSDWDLSTNIEKAFALILKTAKEGKVEAENMPKTLIIFSDMQFDTATDFSNDAYKNMKKQFKLS